MQTLISQNAAQTSTRKTTSDAAPVGGEARSLWTATNRPVRGGASLKRFLTTLLRSLAATAA